MEKDLTAGSVGKTLIRFSLPFFLSYFLQTLYGMADLFIIGRFCPVEGTTGVSVGSQVMHFVTVVLVGLAMGGTVLIGKAVGGKKHSLMTETVGTMVTLFLAISLGLTVILLVLVNPIVALMATPKEAVGEATAYLTVCFLGIPLITMYNVISSVFRGLGDSKSPMYVVAVACVINILLDYLFIGVMGMGAMGAALGTTLSQSVSVLLSLGMIAGGRWGIRFTKRDFKPKKEIAKGILKIGVPVALQDGFVQVSFVVIMIFANLRGVHDGGAVGIVEKVIGILFLVPSSMLQAVSAISAQNLGANKPERARQTLFYGIATAVLWGLLASLAMQVQADTVVGWFTKEEQVISLGTQYMQGYVWDCLFAGIHFCFSGYFCAIGKSGLSFFHNAISILFARIPLAYLASAYFPGTLLPMGYASTIGSVLSVLICVIAYGYLRRKNP